MNTPDIISSLLEQARDKDALAGSDQDNVFTTDALALREAAWMLRWWHIHSDSGAELTDRVTVCPCCGSENAFVVERTKTRGGGIWIRCRECGLRGVLFR